MVVIVLSMIFLSLLVHLVPGDPVRIILGPRATEALSETVRREMDLDSPVPLQVWNFITGAFQGDLGTDFVSQRPVSQLVLPALMHTVILALASLALAAVLGVLLGIYSATHANTWIDRFTSVISIGLITLPPYVAGLFLLLLFTVTLNWFPSIGAGDLSQPADYAQHLVLPAVALAIAWVGYLARLVRTSMLEVMNENYIRTMRAFGLRERTILYKYALKNAVIPTVAVLGVGLGTLMGGAIFVEVIFSRPGLGRLIFDSIETRNFPVVRAGVLAVAVLFVVANLIADLSYRSLDPRIRQELGRS